MVYLTVEPLGFSTARAIAIISAEEATLFARVHKFKLRAERPERALTSAHERGQLCNQPTDFFPTDTVIRNLEGFHSDTDADADVVRLLYGQCCEANGIVCVVIYQILFVHESKIRRRYCINVILYICSEKRKIKRRAHFSYFQFFLVKAELQ